MSQSAPSIRSEAATGFAVLAALLLTGNCTDALGPEDVHPQPDAPFQTSSLQYTLADNGSEHHIIVSTTYVNRSATTVYEGWCTRVLEKKTGKSWTVAFAPSCPTVGVAPNAYTPGTPYQVDFSVAGAYVPNTYPRFLIEPIPGVYRFRIGLYARAIPTSTGLPTLTDPLSVAERVSNEFWLGLP